MKDLTILILSACVLLLLWALGKEESVTEVTANSPFESRIFKDTKDELDNLDERKFEKRVNRVGVS